MTPEQLKEWREQNSFTQIELAKALGVTNVCVSRWEIGMRNIPTFLHLALKWLEFEKGGESKRKGNKTKKKGEKR